MSLRARSLFLSFGMVAAAWLMLSWYKASVQAEEAATPKGLVTAVDHVAPGEVSFQLDLYRPREIPESRHLLFARKADGSLRAWYFHVVAQQPVAPDGDDWSSPGKACEPFEVDPANETIRCVVNDREHGRQLVLRWSWDGKSLGRIAPDLEPVPGEEQDGKFVFGAEALDPNYRRAIDRSTTDA